MWNTFYKTCNAHILVIMKLFDKKIVFLYTLLFTLLSDMFANAFAAKLKRFLFNPILQRGKFFVTALSIGTRAKKGWEPLLLC